MTRVALSLEEDVLRRARHHAESRRTSISKLFVSMICMLDERECVESEVPPVTRQLKGILKTDGLEPNDLNCRDVLEEALVERQGEA